VRCIQRYVAVQIVLLININTFRLKEFGYFDISTNGAVVLGLAIIVICLGAGQHEAGNL